MDAKPDQIFEQVAYGIWIETYLSAIKSQLISRDMGAKPGYTEKSLHRLLDNPIKEQEYLGRSDHAKVLRRLRNLVG
jgi:hypothetical protein